MLDIALKLISKIEEHGFAAYIVGGFVRDYILGIKSNDIDICTNAQPMDIRNIFHNACLPNEAYGSITVVLKNVRFEITTFRREITYINNRKPVEFEYINDLLEDLKRRDFRINTMCMNNNGEIIDLLDGKKDLEKREINTVGNSFHKFSEDALRILRAVRFATILNFNLSEDVKKSILETKHYVRNLSYDRKREELDKIFTSVNVRYGIKLLIELGLDKELELTNLIKIRNYDDLMGIWTQLDVGGIYTFTKNEHQIMNSIKEVLKLDNLDLVNLYKYGLYVNSVAAGIKGIDKKLVTRKYSEIPIKARSDIKINGVDIIKILNITPSRYLREIITDIENKIITGKLVNESNVLSRYVLDNYGTQN